MAIAANVTTIIKIQGKDNASRAFNKVGSATDRARRKLQVMARASRDVMSTLAAPAIAIAGMAALAAKIADVAAETERMRAQARAAFGPEGEKDAIAFARAIGGVGVDSVLRLQSVLALSGVEAKLTVEQLQHLTQIATRTGKTGDDALMGLAKAIETGTGRALKQVGVIINSSKAIKEYGDSIGVVSTEMTAAQNSQAVFDAAMAQAAKTAGGGTNAYAELDRSTARLSVAFDELKLAASSSSGGIVTVIDAYADLIESSRGVASVTFNLGALIAKGLTAPLVVLGTTGVATARALAAAASGDFAGAATVMKQHAAGVDAIYADLGDTANDLVTAINAVGKASAKASTDVGLMGSVFAGFNADAQKIIVQMDKLNKQLAKRDDDKAKARAKAAKAASARRRKAREDEAKAIGRVMQERRADDADRGLRQLDEIENKRKQRIVDAVERESAQVASVRETLALRIDAAEDGAMRMKLQRAQIQMDAMQAIEAVKANAHLTDGQRAREIAAIELAADARRRSLHTQELARKERERQATLNLAGAIGSSIMQVASSVVEGEKATAATRVASALLSSVMLALKSWPHDPAGLVLAAGGAVSAVAQGIKLGTSGATTPSAGGGASPASPAIPSSNGGGGAGTTVINIHGGLGTQAEVGAAVKKAMKSAQAAGV